ncbi:MAG: protein kinase domain-containing protein [Panacagrimonas sp.]
MPDPSSDDTGLLRSALSEFDRLSELDETACAAALATLEITRPAVHARVRRLLDADKKATSAGFLRGDAGQMLAASASGDEAASELAPGIAFGPYRLERRLGAGGMGEVWLGRRSDGLYEGVVAIKTLHAHLSHPAIRARFAREGQIVGRLSHPQIARLLDAGISPDGTLFLVLEYVEGVPLDQWCDQRRLGIDYRLKLMLDVCEAVSHAHSQLVVHRDLKPSNILVTEQGEVKLLDFGIAKLIGLGATPQAELTRIGGRALTPEYAAPEQVLGSAITAATDVYALGVLAYGLLSGAHPYAARHSTVAQIEREVLETDPMPLRQMATHAPSGERSPAERAADRSATPGQLRKRLGGDLDILIGQALRKKPEERYPSVAAFAADLRRHLSHEPITARPDSLAYRTAKFVRRYRSGVIAASAVVLALLAGLSVSLWQAELARQEARRADAEARKAGAVKDFLIDIFQHNQAGVAGGSQARLLTAEQLLARGAQRIRERLSEAPDIRAELLGTMGLLYKHLLLDEPAIALLTEQTALLRRTATDDDRGQRRLAAALVGLAQALSSASEYARSKAVAEEVLGILDGLGDVDSLDRATTLGLLGDIAFWTEPSLDDTARRRYAEALAIVEQHHPNDPSQFVFRVGLGRVAKAQDKLDLAEQHLRQALALTGQPGFQVEEGRIANIRAWLGSVLHSQRRLAAAESELRAALALYVDSDGPDSSTTALARQKLALVLADSGNRGEALELLQAALSSAEAASGEQEDDVAPSIRLDLGWMLYQRGLPDAAAGYLQPLVERYAGLDALLYPTMVRLARVRLAQGRFDEVRSLLDRARVIILQDQGEHSFAFANLLHIEAELALDQGQPTLAKPLLEQAAQAWPPTQAPEIRPNDLRLRLDLARMHLAMGDIAPAEEDLRALLDRILSHPEASRLIDAEAQTRQWLGVALNARGRHVEACEHLQRAVDLRARLDDPLSPWLAGARIELARCLRRLGENDKAQTLIDQAVAALNSHPQLSAPLRETVLEKP